MLATMTVAKQRDVLARVEYAYGLMSDCASTDELLQMISVATGSRLQTIKDRYAKIKLNKSKK